MVPRIESQEFERQTSLDTSSVLHSFVKFINLVGRKNEYVVKSIKRRGIVAHRKKLFATKSKFIARSWISSVI